MPLSAEQRSELLKIIDQQVVECAAELEELAELTKPIAPDVAIGRISRMDAINNKSINDAALRKKKNLKQRLEKTLENLHSEKFGICVRCGAEISFGRLKILPHTSRCTACSI